MHFMLRVKSPTYRPGKAFRKSNSSTRGIIVQQVKSVKPHVVKSKTGASNLAITLQLLRIEKEGAYAGLVAGSPIAEGQDNASRSGLLINLFCSSQHCMLAAIVCTLLACTGFCVSPDTPKLAHLL